MLQKLYICSILHSVKCCNRMQVSTKNTGYHIALCTGSDTESSREIVHALQHRPYIGFLTVSYPGSDFIESKTKDKQSRKSGGDNQIHATSETSRHGR